MSCIFVRPLIALATASCFVTAAGCGGAATTNDEPSPTAQEISGQWESDCIDPGNGQAFTLSFNLTKSDWTLDYAAFADATCATPNLTVRIEGPYSLGAVSTAVPKAREGSFGFGRKTVTPHNDGAAGFLPQACGGGTFAVGQATDITAGCAGLGAYPPTECPTDHDIVALVKDTLRFGVRPADNDMCTPAKRPTALGASLHRKP